MGEAPRLSVHEQLQSDRDRADLRILHRKVVRFAGSISRWFD
jgi:hypothetical protein